MDFTGVGATVKACSDRVGALGTGACMERMVSGVGSVQIKVAPHSSHESSPPLEVGHAPRDAGEAKNQKGRRGGAAKIKLKAPPHRLTGRCSSSR